MPKGHYIHALKTPIEKRRAMADAYASGMKSADVAKTFSCDKQTVLKVLKEFDVTVRKPHEVMLHANRVTPPNKPPQSVLDAILADYFSGMSAQKASGKHGYSKWVCCQEIKRRGLKVRSRPRLHHFNERYFQVVDSEEKAFFLGWITADGCISGAALSIGIARKDREILERFAAAIGSEQLIRDFDTTSSFPQDGQEVFPERKFAKSRIDLSSRAMVDDLLALGVGAAKSLTVKPWQGSLELMRHYWRGVHAGDGWVGRSKAEDQECWYFGLCGNRPMMHGYAQFLAASGIRASVHTHGTIWGVTKGGRFGPWELANLLYGGSTVNLRRKSVLCQELLACDYKRFFRGDIEPSLLRKEYEDGESTTSLAKRYGVSQKTIAVKLRKSGLGKLQRRHAGALVK